MDQVLHMNKGSGDTSYAQNCSVQSKILSLAKPLTEETIEEFLSTNFSSGGEGMGVADLGCASGPTAFSVISEVACVVYAKCPQLGCPLPELRLYLNDLPCSDFNCVFQSLPAFYDRLKQENGAAFGGCFVMGVPGSFYGRLFPKSSLHFVHSSSSLHWLSQPPPGLDGEDGKPVNKGKLYISKSSPRSVLESYALQFRKDFSVFLGLRSAEIAAGGRMVLSFMGRRSGDSPDEDYCCYQWELLAKALMAMAAEGHIAEEKIDSFDAPYFAPSPEEVKAEIEKEGSFAIKRLEAFEIDWDGGDGDASNFNGEEECLKRVKMLRRGTRVAKTVRAVTESMIEHHFGKGIDMDDLFQRYGEIVGNHFLKSTAGYINLAISLVKKD